MIQKILIIVILLFLSHSGFAQDFIKVKDSTINRSSIIDLPVYGTISNGQISDIKINISYNSRIINILSAHGGPSYAIKDPDIVITNDYYKLDSTILLIGASNVQPVNNGIICMLKIEGLAYFDSLSLFTPRSVIINNVLASDFNLQQGIIRVLGNRIFPNFPDFLSYCTPNPFFTEGKFYFNIEADTKVDFKVFTLDGGLVASSEDNKSMFRIFTGNLSKEISDINAVLEHGRYILQFTPKFDEVNSGYHLLIMKTNKGIYNTKFIYSK